MVWRHFTVVTERLLLFDRSIPFLNVGNVKKLSSTFRLWLRVLGERVFFRQLRLGLKDCLVMIYYTAGSPFPLFLGQVSKGTFIKVRKVHLEGNLRRYSEILAGLMNRDLGFRPGLGQIARLEKVRARLMMLPPRLWQFYETASETGGGCLV